MDDLDHKHFDHDVRKSPARTHMNTIAKANVVSSSGAKLIRSDSSILILGLAAEFVISQTDEISWPIKLTVGEIGLEYGDLEVSASTQDDAVCQSDILQHNSLQVRCVTLVLEKLCHVAYAQPPVG